MFRPAGRTRVVTVEAGLLAIMAAMVCPPVFAAASSPHIARAVPTLPIGYGVRHRGEPAGHCSVHRAQLDHEPVPAGRFGFVLQLLFWCVWGATIGGRKLGEPGDEDLADLRATLKALPDLLFEVDIEGRIHRYHSHEDDLLYVPPEQFVGKTVSEVLPPDAARTIMEAIQRAAETGLDRGSVYALPLGGATELFELSVAAKEHASGEGRRFIALAHNISHRYRSEKRLRAEHAFRSAIVDRAAEGICVCHAIEEEPFVRFTVWNQRMVEITGYTMDEINESGWYQSMYPDPEYQAAAVERMARMREGDDLRNEEWVVTRKDGQQRILSISTTILEAEEGGPHVLALMDDVTERARAELALRDSEARYRRMFEQVPIGLYRSTADGRLLDLNAAGRRILALRGEEPLEPIDVRTLYLDPEDRRRFQDRIARDGVVRDFQVAMRCRDGQPIWVSLSAHTVRQHGEEPVYEGAIEDISERKRAEQRLRTQLTALESTADGLVITDTEGRIQWVNPAFTRMTGYAADEAIGQNPRLLKSGHQDEPFYKELWDTILAGRVWSGELVNRRKDGSEYWEEMTITPVRDESERITQFVAVKRDVTARREAMEERERLEGELRQSQKLEAVGRLAGGVAHDFNNMLSIILGYSQLALGRLAAEDPMRQTMERISDAAVRSSQLTKRLLAFSRRMPAQPQPLNLNDCLRSIEKLLRKTITEDIDIRLSLQSPLWTVHLDPTQFDQVVTNLVVNARDAMPRGGAIDIHTRNVTLTEEDCAHHPESRPGDHVELTVSDTGCGMDAETLEHLFEPFFTTKEAGRGTGLGLATVYGIIAQNGGHIEVESQVGCGSTFRILLPRHHAEQATPRTNGLHDALPEGTETILLAEDESSVRTVAETVLRQLGYTVLSANDGEQAVQLCSDFEGQIDLLLTDVVMPGMNGKELADAVLARRPEVRVLFMSGYTADIVAERGIVEEGVRLMEKPFTVSALARAVRAALDAD